MITSDEVNYLVFRYLSESGFAHTSFAFQHESAIYKRQIRGSQVRPGALINLLQKGLQYAEIEHHVNEDGTEKSCQVPFTLLEQHECTIEEGDDARPTKRAKREDLASGKKDRREEKKQRVDREKRVIRDASEDQTTVPASLKNPLLKLPTTSTVVRCAWNPTVSSMIAAGNKDGGIVVWNVPSDVFPPRTRIDPVLFPTEVSPTGHVGVTALAWGPNGDLLAIGTVDGKISVWGKVGDLKFREKQHDGAIITLCWNPNGNLLVSGSVDKTSVIWDVASGQARQRFEFHEGAVLSADWMDDVTFATSSSDCHVYVCRLGDIEPLRQYTHKRDVNKVVWDPKRHWLASCSDDGTAQIWTIASPDPYWIAGQHEKEIVTCQWWPSEDRSILATASFDRTVRLWDVAKKEGLHVFRGHLAEVLSLDFSSDASLLASASSDGQVFLWNMKDYSLERQHQGEKGENMDVQARFCFDGDRLALTCGIKAVTIL
ncbi:WD40-repeat-containing domain protein [Phlyctochytrium arcticum]|nr:WD40-repeat-containing domain protein [Phlyctochytrium arcticum]